MKITFVAFFFSLCTLTVSAQIERKAVVAKADDGPTSNNENKADQQRRKQRFKKLDPTKEEKGKLKEIMHSGKTAKEAIENNTQLSEDDKKKQLRELQKAQALKVQAILTPEQREKFKASRPNKP